MGHATMKLGRFTVRFRYPKTPQVLLLEASKSPHMWSVCDGLVVEPYDLANRQIFLRVKYLFYLFVFARRAPRMAALLCARLRSQDIGVLLSLENHDKFNKLDSRHPRRSRRVDTSRTLFDEVSELLPDLKIVSIQHGQELRRFALGKPKKNVTLLCWGNWTARNFPIFGRNEREFVPVGPLIDSLYRVLKPADLPKDAEICLVSTVKGKDWWGPEIGERRKGYEALVSHLATFAEERGLVVNVALTIDRDQYGPGDAESERNWFKERLGPSVVFTEPSVMSGDRSISLAGRHEPRYVKERYATYLLCDRAKVTIGMTSSVLWESFGRGNRLLAVNHTDNAVYDFPIAGLWSMRSPTYDEFAERLDLLLAMSEVEWKEISGEARRDLITFDEARPPREAINQYLKASIPGF
jgi:hypothetical protein